MSETAIAYPDNLVHAILDIHAGIPCILADDYEAGLAFMIATLEPRQRQIIDFYYKQNMSFRHIAGQFSLSPERIRQILRKSLRKMAEPKYSRLLTVGLSRMIAEANSTGYSDGHEQGYKEGFNAGQLAAYQELGNATPDPVKALTTPIEDLDLSVRAFNCLHREHLKTVDDVLNYPLDNILTIRGMGVTSYKDIVICLDRIGVISRERYPV